MRDGGGWGKAGAAGGVPHVLCVIGHIVFVRHIVRVRGWAVGGVPHGYGDRRLNGGIAMAISPHWYRRAGCGAVVRCPRVAIMISNSTSLHRNVSW